ncbi:MAG TPA: diphosphate--fructose-6-phosphate 1-phosphotransferase [Methylomirabilota bacterium]|nr:diphosphate--fructose-6-phosphate 1-phosphotransferase [Methylomirabilota bacterium]
MKTLAILVGGGPAPGINAVIAAATIEARNRGLRVLGCLDGFRWLSGGDTEHVIELDITDVSRIHFEGGSVLRTSRINPTKTREGIPRVAEALGRLRVDHLITIGGDDTAFSASRLAETLKGLSVAHVPKTIDNDLPLPSEIVTFGFTTACNLGKDLVRNLMQDAATMERWFFVTVMGRHAGHLALGIGGAAGATLTVIPEEFAQPQVGLDHVADVLEGAIIKRRAQGRTHGVAILSEGIGERLAPEALGAVEQDAYGNVRLAEVELGRLFKDRVTASLRARGVDVTIVAKDLGYELRCAPPGAHDIQYCRSLGYWATRFLLEGGSNAMVTIQAARLVPVPFSEMVDSTTGKIRVRYVDVKSEAYETLYAYMIRLKPEDFGAPESVASLAKAAQMTETEFVARFRPLVEG